MSVERKMGCVVMGVNNDMSFDSRVEREAASLAEQGYEVVVLSRMQSQQHPQHETRQGFHIHRIRLLSGSLPKSPLFWLIKYIEFAVRIFYLAWTCEAKVYHAHNLDTLPAMYLAAKLRRAPIIYDSHELWTERSFSKFSWFWRRVEKWLLRRVDATIAANIERAQIMQNEYGAPELPIVLENCPPLHSCAKNLVLQDYARSQGRAWKHIVLYQGGIIPGRSAEVAIRAAQHFPADCGLMFLGSVTDEYKATLLALVEQLRVSDRVLFHPLVPYRDLLLYTASASIGLVLYENTSRNNYLCAPNKLYEYIMVGLAIVASDFPPIARVVIPSELGDLVDPTDPVGIAQAVYKLVDSPTRLEKIRQTGLQISKQEFNWEHQAQRLIELYHTLRQKAAAH